MNPPSQNVLDHHTEVQNLNSSPSQSTEPIGRGNKQGKYTR